MNWMIQGYLLEKYGPRLNLEQLAEVLGLSKKSLYNMVTDPEFRPKTYIDCGKRFADVRDVSEHLDRLRQETPA